MSPQLKNINLYLIVIADLVLFAGAYYGAFLLRFDFALRPVQHAEILAHLPFVIGFKALVFYVLGAYQGMWRYTGLADVLNLAKATFIASLGLVTFGFLLHRMTGQSRAVYVFDGVLTLVLIVGMRVLIRMAYQEGLTADKKRPFLRSWRRSTAKPVLIIGAGDAGEKVYRELLDNPQMNYQVVGFIDDDFRKIGRRLHDRPVLGGLSALGPLARKHGVHQAGVGSGLLF